VVNRAIKRLRLGGLIVYIKLVFISITVLFLLLLTACSVTKTITVTPQDSSQVPQESSVIGQGNHHQVVIEALTFVPLEIYIKLGDTVTWVNEDTNIHTVTSWHHFQDEDYVTHTYIGETWDSGDIKPGQSFSRTFNQLDTHEYLSLPLYLWEEVMHGAVGVVVVVE